MKVFKREFWGMALIWIGIGLFALVLIDSLRPYFPERSPYDKLIRNVQGAVLGLFSRSEKAGPRPEEKPTRRARPEAVRPPALGKDYLTSSTISTEGRQDLWVWEILPELEGKTRIELRIAHAAAGKRGGFWMVAYADTSGDGLPDREIARSEYFQADHPAEWSVWEFETEERKIFVGNAWPPREDVLIYRGGGNWPPEQDFLAERFYYRIVPDQPSATRSAGPAVTNMKVRIF